MDVIISFIGGPLDGATLCSDAADPIERSKAQHIARIIGGCLNDAAKREVKLNPGLTYTVPSEWIKEIAKRDNWSDARVAAQLTKHEYKYSHHKEADGIAEIFMKFIRSW